MCKKEAITGWKSISIEKNGEDKWQERVTQRVAEAIGKQEEKMRRGGKKNQRGQGCAK